MSVAVSAVSGASPVTKSRAVASRAGDDSDNTAQIAALKKALVSLQRERSSLATQTPSSSSDQKAGPSEAAAASGSSSVVQSLDDEISGLQSRIVMLQQQEAMQAAKKALSVQDEGQDEDVEDATVLEPAVAARGAKGDAASSVRSLRRTEREQAAHARDDAAVASAREQGLSIGSNVDTYV